MALPVLPSELLNHIASFLDPIALDKLRLTAKGIYAKTFDDYARRVLGQRWLLAREESLETLMDIAVDERFRDKLTDLRFSTHMLSVYEVDVYDNEPADDKDSEKGLTLWRHFVKLYREQTHFVRFGRPQAILTHAFTKMPALRAVEIGEWCSPGLREQSYRIGWGGNRTQETT